MLELSRIFGLCTYILYTVIHYTCPMDSFLVKKTSKGTCPGPINLGVQIATYHLRRSLFSQLLHDGAPSCKLLYKPHENIHEYYSYIVISIINHEL